jgi:hypothetical protein
MNEQPTRTVSSTEFQRNIGMRVQSRCRAGKEHVVVAWEQVHSGGR